jgi:glycosyltransferase involved in cell wall biosynthesis
VDVSRFASGDPQTAWRTLGVAPDTPLVVFSSRIDAQKRPLDAIEAFQRVAPDFPAARLVFVGSGSQEEPARALAARNGVAERVHFVGYQRNVPDWLAAATVWILPTESENFSLAVLEALAAGCPILSTRCPGNDEVLVEGQNALTVGVGDTDALAAGLRRLLSEDDLRQRLGLAGRETARNYDKEYMVDQYARCYDEVLQQANREGVAQSSVSPV